MHSTEFDGTDMHDRCASKFDTSFVIHYINSTSSAIQSHISTQIWQCDKSLKLNCRNRRQAKPILLEKLKINK